MNFYANFVNLLTCVYNRILFPNVYCFTFNEMFNLFKINLDVD